MRQDNNRIQTVLSAVLWGLSRRLRALGTGFLLRMRDLVNNDSGVSAVEFALLLPVMVLIYAGTVDLSRGVETNKKTNRVASIVGDLVSRQVSVDPAQLEDIFKIGATTMAPNNQSPAIRISFLVVEKNTATGKLEVKLRWSRATAGFTNGSTTLSDLPVNLKQEPQSYIRVEAQYKYIPIISYIIPPISMEEIYYISPRYTNEITCKGC